MAITTAVCNSFKTEALGGTHDLDTDVLKIALIKTSMAGTYGAATTNYSDVTGNTDEASGTGYTVGGATLAGASITLDGSTAIVDFTDPEWTITGAFSARGAILYNSSKSDKAIAVYDFGADISVTNGTFIVRLPAAAAATAVIRLS